MLMFMRINLFSVVFCIFQIVLITAQNDNSCSTPDRWPGTCLEFEQCHELNALRQNPRITAKERKYLRQSICGYANNKVSVCCPNHSIEPSPEEQQCGIVTTNRIVGGVITKINEFPWIARLEYALPNDTKVYECGGSLINDRYVLTAAHCIFSPIIPSDWLLTGVRLGEWNTETNPDCDIEINGKLACVPGYMDVKVESKILHPQYNSTHKDRLHDIALLRLAEAVPTTIHIQPICLPSTKTLRNFVLTGFAVDISGWGATKTEDSSTIKRKATINVWDFNRCHQMYLRTLDKINLNTTQLCAGGENGVDACHGDSGGPLMLELTDSGRTAFYLMGITSFGPTDCGLGGWPGVYTRVGSYIDWIQDNIK